ncbi:zinc phosphodiesterase ELAC protein 2-like [Haliotis rufescens]|uniref:zinc phosphodiesterase ELAC protein 2-like n=1 Tax=Haliotis rufescens TaxID=6454 RepID=UPI00201E7D2D|nr:zinc phosphodiesterase ELAC protein 2-like [Haliotis rufescens]
MLIKSQSLFSIRQVLLRFSSSRPAEFSDVNKWISKVDNMPRIKVERKLRHVKYRERMGDKLKAPSFVNVVVIGSGGRGSPRSVIIDTSISKYLFNCGEGTQRIANEHKVKLAKLENIFITYKSWDNIGGLLGMSLTLDGINVPKINIHGAPGVENITKSYKNFTAAYTTIAQLEKRELSEGDFSDSAIKVEYIPLYNRETPGDATSWDHTKDGEEAVADEPETKRPRSLKDVDDIAVAYLCQLHPRKRKINLEKCVDLGIKTGPCLGQLVEGHSVTLDDGRVVHPDQVLNPEEKKQQILVVECPHTGFLAPLTSCSRLQELQSSDSVEVIVHMSPADIIQTEHYQQWMHRFGSTTQHIIINSTNSDVSHLELYSIQAKLNLLHPTIFPLLPQFMAPTQPGVDDASDSHPFTVRGHTCLKYQLRPKNELCRDQCFQLDREQFVKEAMDMPNVPQLIEDVNSRLKQQSTDGSKYPEVVFLGTGSAIPSKPRNVSCILIHLSEETAVVLDCGEGSAGQLYRHYGDLTDDVLCKIKAVFISHMHADHHLGLFSILSERRNVYKKRGQTSPNLTVLAPRYMRRWLEFYSNNVEAFTDHLTLIPLQESNQQWQKLNAVKTELQLSEFIPVEVDHCPNAFGVALVHKDGWKIVYSGDTMPCGRLVTAGQGCDLLIHEATMDDDLEEEAKHKCHSTTSQAIGIGHQMEAKFTLLTHFSQRYAKLPLVSGKFTDKVGFAFDNMRVTLSDLPLLPLFTEAMKAIFADHYNDMEEKSRKKMRKKILIKDLMANASTSEAEEPKTDDKKAPEISEPAEEESHSVVQT